MELEVEPPPVVLAVPAEDPPELVEAELCLLAGLARRPGRSPTDARLGELGPGVTSILTAAAELEESLIATRGLADAERHAEQQHGHACARGCDPPGAHLHPRLRSFDEPTLEQRSVSLNTFALLRTV